ncbi:hypothetical protein EDC04DRAFT_2565170 [Pisolithus marmoratus]|nr:hypothetical protein EDC04DRAFT_2565170 [Pisolithus marmoratus]
MNEIQFINKLTGMPQEDRADELFSCTKDVCAYECCRDGQRFIFVDTPGFNNQKLSQWDVFKKIATWLEKACRHSIELTGVIYTHDISAVGSVATDVQNLQLLVGLCGDEAVDRVRLVTTMCNEVNKSQADEAEGILARTRWRSLIQAGARVKRFDNTSETAWEIVRGLGDTKKTLLLQKELVQTGKALRGTTAGRCLWQKEPVTFLQVANICMSLLSSPDHSLTAAG